MSEWINVKDRLPEKSEWYLVCDAHNRCLVPWAVLYTLSSGWYGSGFTHWMPFPDLPKEEDNE